MSKYISCNVRAWANKEDPSFEKLILNLPWASERARKALQYARHIINGSWPQGEKHIKVIPYFAYQYAKYVVGERWAEAENAIATEPSAAYLYSKYVIKGRFDLAERTAKWHKSPRDFYLYCKYILKSRWEDVEKKLEKEAASRDYIDCYSITSYIRFVSKSRWTKMEKYIIKSAFIPEYAKVLKNNPKDYEEFYNKILIESLAADKRFHHNYAREYIKSLKTTQPREKVLQIGSYTFMAINSKE